ncbi:4626_t:CDS:2 [Scutellospora calospora]|uniref:4626_t:CDS:1 n=1 Tax=Scutellospora calospora TaxID=85575 RepID=A0ACA9JUN9_9GLOM|nr:4626_t:CDS:2 [Scutellospora calospora]
MAAKLPMLCLQRIFEELRPLDLTTSYSYLLSCVLVNRHWCDIAIPILWRHPFERQWWSEPATKLLDIYISNFPREERNIFINDKFINKYEKPSRDYVLYLRSLKTENLGYATTNWLRNKPYVSVDFKIIYETFCRFFILHARNLELLECETSNMINIFELSGAESSLYKLKSLVVIDQDYPTRLFVTASKVSKNVRTLDITISNHIPKFDPTSSERIADLTKLVDSQKSLEEFILTNEHPKCSECRTRDQSGVLDFRIVFESFINHILTLSKVKFGWIDFKGEFPFLQLAACINLQEIYLDRCQNFGNNQDYEDIDSTSFNQLFKLSIELSPIPSSILCKILTNSGQSLKYLHLDQRSLSSNKNILKDTIRICTLNNPNLLKFSAYIYASEVSNLPDFFSTCQQLIHFKIWDIKSPTDNDSQQIFQFNSTSIIDSKGRCQDWDHISEFNKKIEEDN